MYVLQSRKKKKSEKIFGPPEKQILASSLFICSKNCSQILNMVSMVCFVVLTWVHQTVVQIWGALYFLSYFFFLVSSPILEVPWDVRASFTRTSTNPHSRISGQPLAPRLFAAADTRTGEQTQSRIQIYFWVLILRIC